MSAPGSPSSRHRHRRRLLAWALWPGALPLLAAAADEDEAIAVGTSRLRLHVGGGFGAATRHDASAWVAASAQAVAAYFGRFPLEQALLELEAVDGGGVRHGRTRPGDPPVLRLQVGRETTAAQFRDDWVLVHEMVHLAVPRVARAHNWLHEGIATYVEGVARARAGLGSARRLWIELAGQLPQGLPKPGEGGLDDTPTWARTYWGGTLFCLLADLRIHQRSAGRAGLREALQGLLADGGSYAVAWPLERILASADAAVGQDTLAGLYAQTGHAPYPVDLPALWRELGIAGTTLRDDAPLAWVRRSIAA